MIVDRFLRLGNRIFSSSSDWCRVPFQPLLYMMFWGAALRIVFDSSVPAPFQLELSTAAEHAWLTLCLGCPPLSVLAWWLIAKSRRIRGPLIGLWLRLAADIGMATAVVSFHIADALDSLRFGQEPPDFMSRYITSAAMLFMLLVVSRDVWALVMTDRLAATMNHKVRE